MKLHLIILLGSSCVLGAQESKVHHVSTHLNPVSQMSATMQEEYKKFLMAFSSGQDEEEQKESTPKKQEDNQVNKTQAKL